MPRRIRRSVVTATCANNHEWNAVMFLERDEDRTTPSVPIVSYRREFQPAACRRCGAGVASWYEGPPPLEAA